MGKTEKKAAKNKSSKRNEIKSVNLCKNNSKVSKKAVVLVNTSKKFSKKKKLTRLNYSTDDVVNALKAMDTGLSMRKAAAAYRVPITTLSRRKKNPETSKHKTGPATVFSETEERKIVDWILFRAQCGSPVTKSELLDSIQQYVKLSKKATPFIDSRPSRHWYEGFRKRYPRLSIRKPQNLTLSRAAVTIDDLKEWFEEQTKYLTEKKLNDISPMRIFNCDETYVSLCPPSEKVLLDKGSRSAYRVVDSDKEGFTVLFMYSANGDRAPPMLMFSYKEEVPEKIVKNCPEGWGVGISDNGWMTSESFYEYITNIFYPWLIKQETPLPIVLFLDNHSSHMTFPLVSFCREKGFELIGLVPNSTHIMQPLDISYFHPFKETWKKAVPRWKNFKGVRRVKKEDFPLVLKFALDNMNEEKKAVISGFKAAGLYPFDASAIDYDVFNERKKSNTTVAEQKLQDKLTEDKQKHLLTFENNLSKNVLEEFRSAWLNQTWPRDLQMRGLFEYWLCVSGKPDSMNSTSAINTTTFATSTTNQCIEVQKSETFCQSIIGNENDSATANTKVSADAGNPFKNAFTLPTNYLPKKKRIKIESSGKPKLPSAGTSNQWMQYHIEKENKRKLKEEKLQQKKKLQEEKELLAEEKKKLQDKMKEIQKKIKEETK